MKLKFFLVLGSFFRLEGDWGFLNHYLYLFLNMGLKKKFFGFFVSIASLLHKILESK